MEKIDARKLSADGRAMLRKMVIRLRKQSKMPVKELAAVAGVHVRTVEEWLSRARREGEESLAREKKRGRPVGACRKLTLANEMWLREQIIGQTPQQLKLPFALWDAPGDQGAGQRALWHRDAGSAHWQIPQALGIYPAATGEAGAGARPGQDSNLVGEDLAGGARARPQGRGGGAVGG
jgi:transposase